MTVGDALRTARHRRLPSAFASPKSSTFTRPLGVTMMLAGFEIAVHDAAFVRLLERRGHPSPPPSVAISSPERPAGECAAESVWPGTYSMTRKSIPSPLLSKS